MAFIIFFIFFWKSLKKLKKLELSPLNSRYGVLHLLYSGYLNMKLYPIWNLWCNTLFCCPSASTTPLFAILFKLKDVSSSSAISSYLYSKCLTQLKSWLHAGVSFSKCFDNILQVNLCQKLFFLRNMGRTCCVQKLFWMSETISVHNMF